MQISFPPKVRAGIYITVVLGTAVLVPLHAAGLVNDVVISVWTSLAGAASALAAFNVSPEGK